MISARIKEVRQELQRVLDEQSALLALGTGDPSGPRTLTDDEAMIYDELDCYAARLRRDLALLEEQLEAQAATAKPPPRDWS